MSTASRARMSAQMTGHSCVFTSHDTAALFAHCLHAVVKLEVHVLPSLRKAPHGLLLNKCWLLQGSSRHLRIEPRGTAKQKRAHFLVPSCREEYSSR